MKPERGLVIGKCYPLHIGHMALIDFALENCETVTVLVCVKPNETIDPLTRLAWVQETYLDNPNVIPILNFDTTLTDNSGNPSSYLVSEEWAKYINKYYGAFDCLIGSEEYIEFMAEYMDAKPIPLIYDIDRVEHNISATMIRENPLKYFDHMAEAVKPYYVNLWDNERDEFLKPIMRTIFELIDKEDFGAARQKIDDMEEQIGHTEPEFSKYKPELVRADALITFLDE